jgi:PTH1 family peptidyl-tRNA hydrolase
MKLIVGLGNPGPEYAGTRHNVGWRVAEDLALRAGGAGWRAKFDAAIAEVRLADEKVALARPLTYMNRSGMAVRQMTDFWKVVSADLLIVLDDMALDVGRLRLRADGSAGGHNGLASIIQALGHDCFPRLRIGIGPAPQVEQHADFVLSPFTKAEKPLVDEAIIQAADACECWIRHGLPEAMNRFNRVRDE